MSNKLTLPYPPSTNVYWRSFRGRMVVSEQAKLYKVHVGWLARKAAVECVDGPISVTIDVYRPRRSGDLDNRAKVVLDALQGQAFGNDDQIVELHMRRFDDKANPRVEVTIKAVNNE